MTIDLVKNPVKEFLGHQISAAALVQLIDDLVAEDRLLELDEHTDRLVADLHESLALYVSDETTMREEPGIYLNEDALRLKAEKFITALETFDHLGS